MIYPHTVTLERCSNAGTYKAERFPFCGCQQCWAIWYAKGALKPEEFEAGLAIGNEFWTDFASYFHER